MKQQPNLRSPLGKVRGHGSAKEGTAHFIHQRVTAVALVPLSLWFVASILCVATSGDITKINAWFASGIHATVTILLLLAMFHHAKLGVQVVIEDYIHCPCLKLSALFANVFSMYGLAALSVLAVLKLHLHM